MRLANYLPRSRSLYWRFFSAFLLCVALMGVIQQFAVVGWWRTLSADLTQRLHWDLASEIANELQPALLGEYDSDFLQQQLHAFALLNPQLGIYVLDSTGSVMAFADPYHSVPPRAVSLEPIQIALQENLPDLPLYGSNPHGQEPSVFSVAPLQIGTTDGYLYVVLQSSLLRYLSRLRGQFYILSYALSVVAFGAAVGTLAAFFLFRYLSRNLQKLMVAVERFRAGELNSRAVVDSQDEVLELAETFNEMAATIEQNVAELEEQDSMRRGMLANISHDLRGPITAVTQFASELQKDELEQEKRLKLAEQILIANRLQKDLVHDLFELAVLDAKEAPPALVDFAIDETLEDIVSHYRATDLGKAVELTLNLPSEPLIVHADELLIERVLRNLIENAIRYSANEGGVVRTHVQMSENQAEVVISDNGIGIAEDELPHIFKNFYRSKEGQAHTSGGTGLGLAIVKKILDMHGSTVRVESTFGKGSSFRFTLPLASRTAADTTGRL